MFVVHGSVGVKRVKSVKEMYHRLFDIVLIIYDKCLIIFSLISWLAVVLPNEQFLMGSSHKK